MSSLSLASPIPVLADETPLDHFSAVPTAPPTPLASLHHDDALHALGDLHYLASTVFDVVDLSAAMGPAPASAAASASSPYPVSDVSFAPNESAALMHQHPQHHYSSDFSQSSSSDYSADRMLPAMVLPSDQYDAPHPRPLSSSSTSNNNNHLPHQPSLLSQALELATASDHHHHHAPPSYASSSSSSSQYPFPSASAETEQPDQHQQHFHHPHHAQPYHNHHHHHHQSYSQYPDPHPSSHLHHHATAPPSPDYMQIYSQAAAAAAAVAAANMSATASASASPALHSGVAPSSSYLDFLPSNASNTAHASLFPDTGSSGYTVSPLIGPEHHARLQQQHDSQQSLYHPSSSSSQTIPVPVSAALTAAIPPVDPANADGGSLLSVSMGGATSSHHHHAHHFTSASDASSMPGLASSPTTVLAFADGTFPCGGGAAHASPSLGLPPAPAKKRNSDHLDYHPVGPPVPSPSMLPSAYASGNNAAFAAALAVAQYMRGTSPTTATVSGSPYAATTWLASPTLPAAYDLTTVSDALIASETGGASPGSAAKRARIASGYGSSDRCEMVVVSSPASVASSPLISGTGSTGTPRGAKFKLHRSMSSPNPISLAHLRRASMVAVANGCTGADLARSPTADGIGAAGMMRQRVHSVSVPHSQLYANFDNASTESLPPLPSLPSPMAFADVGTGHHHLAHQHPHPYHQHHHASPQLHIQPMAPGMAGNQVGLVDSGLALSASGIPLPVVPASAAAATALPAGPSSATAVPAPAPASTADQPASASTVAAASTGADTDALGDGTVREQPLRFPDDMYTPRYVRFAGAAKEGRCDHCPTPRWLQLKNSAFWYHTQFFHGISSVSGQPFRDPVERRRVHLPPPPPAPPKDGKESKPARASTAASRTVEEGRCHQCNEWVQLSSSKRRCGAVAWYRHAHKCHVYAKPLGGILISGAPVSTTTGGGAAGDGAGASSGASSTTAEPVQQQQH
ncbi:hypothetical protein H9P43_002274 [Blastocladiella emersonii ATCC 22665]|nr:hypothetical protein H9P43_002274 [Blastocladiella emersonii ATCC 22665]